jgi:16S rRNA (cytosine967-C5)-methyltransferase
MLAALKQAGLKAAPTPLSPWGIRVTERPSLASLGILKDGLVDIQDEGSQLIAKILDAQPGERVVDFCAGAGGKTLAIAACMQNKGRIIACDVMERRLKNSTERFRRAGIHNIQTHALASARDPWVKKQKGTFDRVLVDAPCSGSGTWRRNPDARWRNLGPDLPTLIALQTEILDSAARLVRPGGRLVYATCSLYAAENDEQIDRFLAGHPDFTVQPCGIDGAKYLALTPAQHGTDGFFGAVLQRNAPIPSES